MPPKKAAKPKKEEESPKGITCIAVLWSILVLVAAAISASYVITDTFDFNGLWLKTRKIVRSSLPVSKKSIRRKKVMGSHNHRLRRRCLVLMNWLNILERIQISQSTWR